MGKLLWKYFRSRSKPITFPAVPPKSKKKMFVLFYTKIIYLFYIFTFNINYNAIENAIKKGSVGTCFKMEFWGFIPWSKTSIDGKNYLMKIFLFHTADNFIHITWFGKIKRKYFKIEHSLELKKAQTIIHRARN